MCWLLCCGTFRCQFPSNAIATTTITTTACVCQLPLNGEPACCRQRRRPTFNGKATLLLQAGRLAAMLECKGSHHQRNHRLVPFKLNAVAHCTGSISRATSEGNEDGNEENADDDNDNKRKSNCSESLGGQRVLFRDSKQWSYMYDGICYDSPQAQQVSPPSLSAAHVSTIVILTQVNTVDSMRRCCRSQATNTGLKEGTRAKLAVGQ